MSTAMPMPSALSFAKPASPVTTGSRFWKAIPWVLVALQFGWFGYGCFPICPVEGDEQGVMFGVQGMLTHDLAFEQVRYTYEVQPGAYHLLASLTRLSGLPVETVFGTLTVVGALGFVVAGAWFLKSILHWPFAWLLAAMLWCQEVTSAAYYMNTSAFAGGIVVVALIQATRTGPLSWLWSALLLALSGWIRADSLLIAPACLGLTYFHARTWKPALARTSLIAITSGVLVVTLYWLSDAPLTQGLKSYAGRDYWLTDGRTLFASSLMLLSPLLTLGAMFGVGFALWQRHYALVLIVLGGSAATFAAYATSLSTPKYFYYMVPFVLLPALYLLGHIVTWLRTLPRPVAQLATGFLVLLAAVEGFVGIRTLTPLQRMFTTEPTWVTFLHHTSGEKTYELVLGPGELLLNADGFRLRTGMWFAPLCWHREKTRTQTQLAALTTLIGNPATRSLVVFWGGWVPYQLMSRQLFAAGFRPEGKPLENPPLIYPDVWRKDGRVVHLKYHSYVASPYVPEENKPSTWGDDPVYFIGDSGRQPIREFGDGRTWHALFEPTEGFITLHQLR